MLRFARLDSVHRVRNLAGRPVMEVADMLTDLTLSRDAVMDAAAISLARENTLPIVVFNIHAPGAFAAVIRGEGRFTRIIEQQ